MKMKRLAAVILIIASALVISWFKDGYILGVAEDGLIFHNLSNYFHQAQYTWMEYPGLGSPSLTLIAGKPTYFLLSYLQNSGIPGFLVQAGVMWFLLVSAGLGAYLLIRELFPRLPNKYLLLGILFYWFNPISLTDVWNRFLLNYIFFFALLPLATYLYIKGLRTKRFIWAFLLNISLIFYSYAFSYIAFTLLFWIWLFLLTSYYGLFARNRELTIFSIKYFFLNLVFFGLVNSWWILPLVFLNISGGASPTANLFLNQNNTGLLDALSKSVGNLTGVFKLSNASFLSSDSPDWAKEYSFPLLLLLMYAITGTVIYFLIRLRKDPTVLFLGSLFLTALFLSKGNNPPFGEIYNFIYNKIIFLQVFRNPFEKFGYLLALTSTLLLGPAIYELISQTKGIFKKLLYPFFFTIIFFYLGYPLFTGLAFTNKFPPTNNYSIGYKVRVPDYYNEVNNFLIGQGNHFRYIGLPIKDEGITYNWEKGYAGAELTVPLFSNSGILLNTSTPFFNQVVPEIEHSLLSDSSFDNLANLLNARYYILRYDINYQLRQMTDPALIEKKLKESELKGEVGHIAAFGKVGIWENLKWRDNTFYAAAKTASVKSYDDEFDLTKINVLKGEILLDENGAHKVGEVIRQASGFLPELSYKKINPARYILHIKNAAKPFFISFSELYNDGWKATYDDGKILNNHIRVNVFGNGWLADRTGDYDLVVEFAPQKYMDIGEKISIASYILITAGLLVLRMKQKI